MSDLPRDPDALGSSLADGWGAAEMPNDSNCLRLRAVIVPRGRRPGEAPPSSWAESLARQGLEPAWTFDEAFAAYDRVQKAMWRYVQRHAPVQADAVASVSETMVAGGEQTPASEGQGRSLPAPHVQAPAIRREPTERRKRPTHPSGPNDHLHVSSRGMGFIFKAETDGHLDRTAHPYWPGGESGVILGPGYDLQFRTPGQIIEDLQRIGLSVDQARILSAAGKVDPRPRKFGFAGLKAKVFADSHKGIVTLSESQQRTLLSLALPQYEDDVRRVIRLSLTQNEFDALVSFDFAHGSGNLTKLNDKNKREISDIIRHFDDGRDAGLVKRRGQEADEFLLPDSGDIKSPDTVQ